MNNNNCSSTQPRSSEMFLLYCMRSGIFDIFNHTLICHPPGRVKQCSWSVSVWILKRLSLTKRVFFMNTPIESLNHDLLYTSNAHFCTGNILQYFSTNSVTKYCKILKSRFLCTTCIVMLDTQLQPHLYRVWNYSEFENGTLRK